MAAELFEQRDVCAELRLVSEKSGDDFEVARGVASPVGGETGDIGNGEAFVVGKK